LQSERVRRSLALDQGLHDTSLDNPSSMRSLIDPSTPSDVTSFVTPAATIRPAFCLIAA
jgi:hypothetical protein